MLTIPAAIFSGLLVVTGMAKAWRPTETARALGAMGVPAPTTLTYVVAFAETGIGLAAIALGSGLILFAQGMLYVGFLAWLLAARRRGVPMSSCGCLGRPDTPPYWGHVVLDVMAATLSVGAALSRAGRIALSADTEALTGVLIVGAGVLLGWLVINHGARLYGALKRMP